MLFGLQCMKLKTEGTHGQMYLMTKILVSQLHQNTTVLLYLVVVILGNELPLRLLYCVWRGRQQRPLTFLVVNPQKIVCACTFLYLQYKIFGFQLGENVNVLLYLPPAWDLWSCSPKKQLRRCTDNCLPAIFAFTIFFFISRFSEIIKCTLTTLLLSPKN